MLICGYFRALYGSSIDLFGSLTAPIVEQFEATDQLDQKLKSAMAELIAQEVGTGAMTTSLMKQILIILLRRSLSSLSIWTERIAIFKDPQIARAFARMAARPSAHHTVESLCYAVGLSRSAFMARFTAVLGQSPMTVLRQLRMRHAAVLLSSNTLSIDQVAFNVGYSSRTSFSRAFRKMYGSDPSEFRAAVLSPTNPHQEQVV
jgi:AraC family transcriptional activator of mtrCDE